MSHSEAAFAHHLFEVTVRKLIAAIPSDAQKDDGRLEVPPLERGLRFIHEDNSRRVRAELKDGL